MLVKDVLLRVCEFTEQKDLKKGLEENSELTSQLEEIKQIYLQCFNFVHNEIVSEYLPFVKMENFFSEDGKIDFSKFSEKVLDIVSVKNCYGFSVNFEVFGDYLLTKKGNVTVKYNCMPKQLKLDDEFSTTVPDRVYAYGVMRELCLMMNTFNDAAMWDERFKNSIEVLVRKKGNTILPRRRWI